METIKRFMSILLDIFLPRQSLVMTLETLSADEFIKISKKPLDRPQQGIESLFYYKDPIVRRALWELKYRGNKKIAKIFGELLADEIISNLSELAEFIQKDKLLIIPIPLSRKRLRERGWNQAEMIALVVSKKINIPINTHVVEKIRHTKPQTTLSKSARIHNLKNCFSIKNPELLKNRNIILIDDVTTTGSTIEEVRRALLEKGAARVLAFTVAH